MRFRVWTLDYGEEVTCMSDWKTRGECKKMIWGRWGHWPPFAIISTIKSAEKFKARYVK